VFAAGVVGFTPHSSLIQALRKMMSLSFRSVRLIPIFICFTAFFTSCSDGDSKKTAVPPTEPISVKSEEALDQFAIAMEHGDKAAICKHAGLVAEAFIQEKDPKNYRKWKDRESQACAPDPEVKEVPEQEEPLVDTDIFSLGAFSIPIADSTPPQVLYMQIALETKREDIAALKRQKTSLKKVISKRASIYTYAETKGPGSQLRIGDDLLSTLNTHLGEALQINRLHFSEFNTQTQVSTAKPALKPTPGATIVGQWTWKHAGGGGKTALTLRKAGGKHSMFSRHNDGSTGTAQLRTAKKGSKTKLYDPDGLPGEYYLLSPNGTLQICDEMSCFERLQRR
jgi:hypothetical protein